MTSQSSHSMSQTGKGKRRTLDSNVSTPSDAGTDKNDQGWRYIVRNFRPEWFSVTMGTGIVSILLNTLPYNGRWLYWLSIIFFVFNVLLFLILSAVSILRYILYPGIFTVMITHPTQSLFLSTFPMGFATIIDMFCLVCVPAWGQRASYVALAMWIGDAVFSVCTCFGILFIMMTRRNKTKLGSMSAAWLLPSASCVVAAASGGIVAEVVPNPQIALGTLVTSLSLWGVGVPLTSMVLVIYLVRLMLHKMPPKAVIVSTFLPLIPIGQGGFGIQKLGSVARDILPQTNTLPVGTSDTLYEISFIAGLVVWAFGLFWLSFAVGSITRIRTFPFNLGWWAFTFPLGVYATCTSQLGREMPSRFFAVLGTILSLIVVLSWIVVTVFTIHGISNRTLFVAPCLAVLREKKRRELEAERFVNINSSC